MNKVFLVLSDGSVYNGQSFGYPAPKVSDLQNGTFAVNAGEVIFNTSMTGYHEILTDPSYTGQIVLMTYPHIGNYGTDASWNEGGPEPESRKTVKSLGLIVREYYDGPIPPGRISLDQFLKDSQIPGISGIDTRRLTLDLRDNGSRNGIIVQPDTENRDGLSSADLAEVLTWLKGQPEMTGRNLVTQVGTDFAVTSDRDTPMGTDDKEPFHMVLVDCGIKGNIIRELEKRDITITLLPSSADAETILAVDADGVLFSNGPGDPAVLSGQIDAIRGCVGKVPVFGICLGHQLISLALGAKTYKMKFGHHGGNHPVRDEFTKKVCVTSQNHGFAVDRDTLPEQVKVWFTNTNDNSIEGIHHSTLPVMSVQFHPEAAPGPMDANWIFDAFIKRAVDAKNESDN